MCHRAAPPPRTAGMRGQAGSGRVKFQDWISEIEDTVTFVVDAEPWRKYFDAGLTPLQAIEQHRVDEEV